MAARAQTSRGGDEGTRASVPAFFADVKEHAHNERQLCAAAAEAGVEPSTGSSRNCIE